MVAFLKLQLRRANQTDSSDCSPGFKVVFDCSPGFKVVFDCSPSFKVLLQKV